ncbi:isocitrate/isopropylmalate dehydrogenase family protein [Bradyrhizobium sp. LHD-71]|uniref:isocitrate/isopropylmalate dehydrogenase family protein n=1 Tax=Bradyrhizobium sp. LHD-71 TaxID=3072141 RepID=UPI00280ED73F|nr:isocitrate/isopropylmalate dehydrogenase family protein [Bradyrhizobium sp. LHD-71]MDQ8727134.1 isocitrate/isopropylmalate dehydrogenase family protein [Bradyrhizobium sp. LHD-71]
MKLLVLPGDGIGPEITDATLAVLAAADRRFGLGLTYETMDIGWAAYHQTGTTLPDAVLDAARTVDGVLLGPISHLDYPPRNEGGVNVSAAFRTRLDLYANVRPARTRPGVPHRGTDMNLVIMRECTEGMYPDRNMHKGSGEFMPTEDIALSLRKITRPACRRIAIAAFELARRREKHVTAVHKANNFILTDGLFLEEVRAVASGYPDVRFDEYIVDAMAAWLVRDASRFDVIVSTNFYCDILSDLASELSGGLGLAGSINANETRCVAQAQHGSAPDIAGQGKANPTSLILSAAMLLDWLAEKSGASEPARAAQAINVAIDQALARVETCTPDLGGPLSTASFGKVVSDGLLREPS